LASAETINRDLDRSEKKLILATCRAAGQRRSWSHGGAPILFSPFQPELGQAADGPNYSVESVRLVGISGVALRVAGIRNDSKAFLL
jgi:hypothetical protein